MRRLLRVIIAVASLTILSSRLALAASPGANACALGSELRTELNQVWDLARPILHEQVEQGLAAGNPHALYLLAQYTQPLIGAARDCGMHEKLDELAHLYLLPFGRLGKAARGSEQFDAWLCSGPACPSWSAGAEPFEVILYSAQFLYGAAALINAVSLVPEAERTPAMNKLLKHAPFIARTYERWLSSHGDPLYPRGVRQATAAAIGNRQRTDDKQLQIAGGIVELLCAAEREPGGLDLPANLAGSLRDYTALYWQLIQSRARFDAAGHVTYDEAWGTIPRARCASHTKLSAPRRDQCMGTTSLSLDLGHFARVPAVIESYHRCGFADGNPLLRGLAMQFADRVWNGSIANPRFFNYFSGAGMYGWYNRTFDDVGRVRSRGWAPLALSNKGPAFFHLGRYNPRVKRIAQAYLHANRGSLSVHKNSDSERVLYVLAALPHFVE